MNFTPQQLLNLAQLSGFNDAVIIGDLIQVTDVGLTIFDPIHNASHSMKLLEYLIRVGDCRLLFDDGVNEFFIYTYNNDGSPLANNENLSDAILNASYELFLKDNNE